MAKKAAREMPVTSATGNGGFTLLELLVVLAIMVLLAGAWPFAARRLFPTQQLRNESQNLIAALRSARMTARLSGAPQTIDLLQGGSGYQANSESHVLPTGIIARMRSDAASQTTGVRFFSDGSSSGGVIDLKLSNRTVSIAVGRITGRAELVE
jgi:general secretion pathway protein H